MKTLNIIATVLVAVWGLNWGLYVFDINLVNLILWTIPVLEKLVYILVGLSSLLVLFNLFVKD